MVESSTLACLNLFIFLAVLLVSFLVASQSYSSFQLVISLHQHMADLDENGETRRNLKYS